MNNVVLIGRLAKDVELRRTNSGKAVASFTLAVNKDFKNEEGGYDADFIDCVASIILTSSRLCGVRLSSTTANGISSTISGLYINV